jgi:Zn-dependent metalloprotease
MGKQRLPHFDRLRTHAAIWGVGGGAAAIAIAIAMLGMTALFLLLDALGVSSAPETLAAAAQDAVVALYAVQLVGFSFFNETAELRFVAIPGLLLVGFAVGAVSALAVRAFRGSVQRKMSVALAMPVAYALLLGTAALLVPLHFTAPGFGTGVVVEPSLLEAFLLPLVWGLLFASIGGLVGIHGRSWHHVAAQRLGVWATPLNVSLRALALAFATSTALVLAGSVVLVGGDLSWVTGGGFGYAARVIGAVLLILPTLAASVLVSGFGISFDWRLDTLAHGEGSVSAFGGPLPTTGEDLTGAQGVPGLFALAPVIAIGMVFAIGWISARRSGSNVRLALANAARAATLVTLAVWLLALLARVEAQAGGLLGFHLAPDVGALLWRVPLLALLGTLAGSFAWALTRGPLARRQLASTLRSAARPQDWALPRPSTPRLGPSSGSEATAQGLTWRAALTLGFVAIPVLAVWMGATGTATSAAPGEVSMTSIEREAEQELKRASLDDETVLANVDPETRVVSTANVETPLRALGIASDRSRVAKAQDVLDHYGDLLGLSHPRGELAGADVSVDSFGGIHVFLQQVSDGLPVYAGAVGIHLSPKGDRLTFLSGSVIPNAAPAEDKAQLSKGDAIEVAKQALPGGSLAEPVTLQVYAGLPPYVSAANARLAWTVWLLDSERQESNEYIVDAVTGEILDTVPKGSHALDREVYDAEGKSKLPGTLARKEKEEAPTGDPDVDNAYDHSGDVYNFYSSLSLKDGPDGKGMKMLSSVNVSEPSGAPLRSAYWDAQGRAVFGDGFAAALDVVGHEFTHGYTQFSSGLVGTGQSGALNESISDIGGTAIEAWKTEEVDWEIGEDLPEGLGPIRSLSEPGKFGDPKSIAEWVKACIDNFGVHTNSLITSHAFYLATTNLNPTPNFENVAEMSLAFQAGFGEFLAGNPTASVNDARLTTIAATSEYLGEEATEAVEEAFTEVGLNGTAEPPTYTCPPDCSFAQALDGRRSLTGDEAAEMLATLYKARGELAQDTPAGEYFMPLYEDHMPRISELVSLDPELADLAVTGLEELTPALDGLVEGEGEQFALTSGRMGEIEAALERLAQDDRIYGGENAGELADLIEDELDWMGLPSYGGMNFQSGFARLNKEAEVHSMMLETGTLIDPNCTGIENGGYENNFHINGFYVDTPGHRIPGQVSPLNSGGVICGAEVEALEEGEQSGCTGEKSLNTSASTILPPGSQVRSTKTLTNNAWVGEAIGWSIACAGDETRIIYGQAGLLAKSSWNSEECPTEAISCYEGLTGYDPGGGGETVTGRSFAWVTEKEGVLKMTTSPVAIESQGYQIKAGFGQFEIKLCGRAGGVKVEGCGGPNAPWIHQNGEAGEVGCPGGKGIYTASAKNANGEETLPISSCVRWEPGAHMQTVDAPNSLRAVSCVPGTTTCVTANNNGNAHYSTGVSASATASWTSWTGAGVSPAHDVACPTTTLCLLAAGTVEGGGGNLYRASSLGGTFLTSFKPTQGVGAISCPSSSFCVTALEGGGFIRYTTNPSGILWPAVAIGTGAMKDVTCLSNSFCAVVDAAGNVRVATTEKGVKEATGWKATGVNGGASLSSVACSSTSSCIAIDGSNEVIKLSIAEGGGATASSQAIAGASELTDVNCVGATCVAVDDDGAVFASTDSGATWDERFQARGKLTSVSCASSALCAAGSDSGDVIKLDPVP